MSTSTDSRAVIALADGTTFWGTAFGAVRGMKNPVVGEVVFNTSMYGYQEILTDPSYAGQIVTFTYPHIGNVGCNPIDNESGSVFAEGLIIRDTTKVISNFRASQSLSQYASNAGIMGLAGIDTRALVTHLRDTGSKMGAIATGPDLSPEGLVEVARAAGSMEGREYVSHVSCKNKYAWNEGIWSLGSDSYRRYSDESLCTRPHVVALDFGIKFNILRLLVDAGFRVTVVPATTSASEVVALKPDGVFLSNGPGDPATLSYIVREVKELVGRCPIFGICLGHQILGQVFGGRTYKLKFGHRGGNHPVMDYTTGKVEITVQNHGFAVDRESLPPHVEVTHVNLNDQTVEGLQIQSKKVFSVQYHPEASPGPQDSRYLFRRFYEWVVA